MYCTKQYNYQFITSDPIQNIFTVYTRGNQQSNTLAYKATDVHKIQLSLCYWITTLLVIAGLCNSIQLIEMQTCKYLEQHLALDTVQLQ